MSLKDRGREINRQKKREDTQRRQFGNVGKEWIPPCHSPWYKLALLDFELLGFRIVSESISVVLSYQVCDNLLQQPQKTNIEGTENLVAYNSHSPLTGQRWMTKLLYM